MAEYLKSEKENISKISVSIKISDHNLKDLLELCLGLGQNSKGKAEGSAVGGVKMMLVDNSNPIVKLYMVFLKLVL